MRTVALFLLAVATAAAAPAGDAKAGDGPAQTYWWCEMHHAPQNIQNIVKRAPSDLVLSLAKARGPVEASQARAEDLRTQVISYSGPARAGGLANDPVPPQTFWCEMHQGAQSTLTAEDTAKLSESLSQLTKEALVARVIEAERKAGEYQSKVRQIQEALKA